MPLDEVYLLCEIYSYSKERHSVSQQSFAQAQSLPTTMSLRVQYSSLSLYLQLSTLHLIDLFVI